MSKSLISVTTQTVETIGLTLEALDNDVVFVRPILSSILRIAHTGGYGKVTVYISKAQVTKIVSEQTELLTIHKSK